MKTSWFLYMLTLCFYLFDEVTSGPQPIVNGKLADARKFGYHVSVETFNISICGGGIIDDRHIVSAAHCFVNDENEFEVHPLKVVVGTGDLNNECEHKVTVDVEQVFIPTEYDVRQKSKNNRTVGDIAVLKLKSELGIKKHKYLKKLKLPDKEKNYDNKTAVVTGFGFNTYDKSKKYSAQGCGSRDYKLRYTEAIVINKCLCEMLTKKKLNEKHLCAAANQSDPNNAVGVCDGDSGGPLVYKKEQLIGIVSNSPKGCREDKAPAIYTRVWPFVNFIKSIQEERINASIVRSTTLITTDEWKTLNENLIEL